jgi:hypothetical protein
LLAFKGKEQHMEGPAFAWLLSHRLSSNKHEQGNTNDPKSINPQEARNEEKAWPGLLEWFRLRFIDRD